MALATTRGCSGFHPLVFAGLAAPRFAHVRRGVARGCCAAARNGKTLYSLILRLDFDGGEHPFFLSTLFLFTMP